MPRPSKTTLNGDGETWTTKLQYELSVAPYRAPRLLHVLTSRQGNGRRLRPGNYLRDPGCVILDQGCVAMHAGDSAPDSNRSR